LNVHRSLENLNKKCGSLLLQLNSSLMKNIIAISCFVSFLVCFATLPLVAGDLTLNTRYQERNDTDVFEVRKQQRSIPANQTAIVVCDMWDKHWCKGATSRVAEMAPRMNEVINKAREQGVMIIHCPSSTMGFYEGTPGRKLALSAPVVEAKVPLQKWCHLDPDREAPLPIDDSDGGCDCEPQCENYQAWTRQIDTIEIHEGDAITDTAEAYNVMKERGITNVIVMGVHMNMCVLGRPFSIRQMVYQDQNVFLMRDLTDTMYNSRMSPFVSHFKGNDLVADHIEKYWCPTVTSVDILGGKPFEFQR
jgi:nicotinamidase-related amidase